MRNIVRWIVIGCIACLFGVFLSCKSDTPVPASPDASDQVAHISGKVMVPADSGVSLEGLYVKVEDTGTVVRTDSTGSFLVSGLTPGKTYTLYVSTDPLTNVTAKDLVSQAPENVETPNSSWGALLKDIAARMDAYEESVSLTRNGSISGKVILAGKGADANGGIMAYIPGTSFLAISADDGTYTISGVPQGIHKVKFSNAGYVSKTVEDIRLYAANDASEAPSATVADQTLLSAYGSVVGTATLYGETDFSGITILLRSTETTNDSYTGSTAADGSFAINGINPGSYTALLTHSGFASLETAPFTIDASVENEIPESLVLYTSLATITGTVTLEGKEDHAGISILMEGADGVNASTVTNTSGSFSKQVKPGTYRVTASCPGFASVSRFDIVANANSESQIVFPPLTSAFGSISGLVQQPFALVSLIPQGTTVPLQTLESGSDGSYGFSAVEPGSYTVAVSKQGYVSQQITDVMVSQGTETRLDPISLLLATGTIKGNAAMEGVSVSLTLEGQSAPVATTLSGADGSYQFALVEPGVYTVVFAKDGYVTQQKANNSIAQASVVTVNADTFIPSEGGISGQVVLSGSSDNSGVQVIVTSRTNPQVSKSTLSVQDGSYAIAGLVAGQYTVSMVKAGFVTDNSKMVTVELGSMTQIPLVTLVNEKVTVKGAVTLSGAATHEGVSILLRNSSESRQYTASTDQKGSYTINDVVPDVYTVFASKDGYASATSDRFTISPSVDKMVPNMTLDVAVRSITGSVKLELRSDYSGALITATNIQDDSLVYSALSNSEGAYSLAGMRPGEYILTISSTGYNTVTLPTVDVLSGSTKQLDSVEVKIARGTISGVATLEGRSSHAGITVELLQGNDVYDTKTTNEAGEYDFSVPAGNYSGVRYTKEDFAPKSKSISLALFANNKIAVGNEMLTAISNTVQGTVDVLTTDDESSVTVSFDGHPELGKVATSSDGGFSFLHVPVGSYTMRFTRENCSDVTVLVQVEAKDVIDLGKVSVTPNTGSITGKVNLIHGTSLKDILVTVDMKGKELSTKTDASGRYEIGGVSIASEYTVRYSKDGWDEKTQTITPQLKLLEVREMPEIALEDTTAPVLGPVVINNGANTAADKQVVLHFNVTETGSGTSKVMVTYDNRFDETVTKYAYSPDMPWTLPASNGKKTIYVQVVDASGNASNIVSASVTLTDQKHEVKGVLSGDDLHWTKEQSPYLVTGNLLVQKTDALTIDPGVDVQFAGDYYLKVEGTMQAIGTQSEKISFSGVDDGENNWGYIKDENGGTELAYTAISGLKSGLQGKMLVRNSTIVSSSMALGSGTESYNETYFSGTIRESEIKGKIGTGEATLIRNTIALDDASFNETTLSGNVITGARVSMTDCVGENNKVKGDTVQMVRTGMRYTTFDGGTIGLGGDRYGNPDPGGLFDHCVFEECTFSAFAPAIVRASSMIGCGDIVISTQRSQIEELDMRGNFWGYDKTRIFNERSSDNVSFIKDFYDDFNLTKVVFDTYQATPIDGAGYQGDSYYPKTSSATVYAIGDTGPAGGLVFYDKGYYSEGWRYLEAKSSPLGEYVFAYYRPTATSTYLKTGTGYAIGAGKLNTEMLVETMGEKPYSQQTGEDTVTEYAAKVALDHTEGGYDDWFLPSRDELDQIYRNLHRNGKGNFADSYCWSSSENYYADAAWFQYFSDGYQNNNIRYLTYSVCLVRAF